MKEFGIVRNAAHEFESDQLLRLLRHKRPLTSVGNMGPSVDRLENARVGYQAALEHLGCQNPEYIV